VRDAKLAGSLEHVLATLEQALVAHDHEQRSLVDPDRGGFEVDVVAVGEPLKSGDTLVVCSDGLHGQMSDDEIAGFAMGPSLEQACAELIELANARGGPDNITVAMLRFERQGAPAGNPIGRWLRSFGGKGGAA